MLEVSFLPLTLSKSIPGVSSTGPLFWYLELLTWEVGVLDILTIEGLLYDSLSVTTFDFKLKTDFFEGECLRDC